MDIHFLLQLPVANLLWLDYMTKVLQNVLLINCSELTYSQLTW
uniref:Uncharacterized protein n=1 Tax=Arundo donax TaxID=35708 RepID=A0A0A9FCF2_ARUDO